jgi:hypothetical protein
MQHQPCPTNIWRQSQALGRCSLGLARSLGKESDSRVTSTHRLLLAVAHGLLVRSRQTLPLVAFLDGVEALCGAKICQKTSPRPHGLSAPQANEARNSVILQAAAQGIGFAVLGSRGSTHQCACGRRAPLVKRNRVDGRRALRMDRRKRGGTTRANRNSTRIKRLTLDLDETLHRAIKTNAAEEGVTMAQKLRVLLTDSYRVTDRTR